LAQPRVLVVDRSLPANPAPANGKSGIVARLGHQC